MTKSDSSNKTHELVRKAYGDVAKKTSSCCCGPSGCDSAQATAEGDLGLSCGDPVTFSCLEPGDIVLDLGSGAGKDVFLAARKVGASGWVIGVDMTDEMLTLARRNAEKFQDSTGLDNVEFRKGCIEELPLEDASVAIIISNCVINLSPDKPRVFREAFRVLRPGGRMVVSDIVLDKPLPSGLQDHAGLYTACIAGALPRAKYLGAILQAGFTQARILTERGHKAGQAQGDPITSEVADSLEGVAASITVFAEKPK